MSHVRKPKTATAAWIVEQRKRLGWKSEDLATRLDVADSTVRGWESGRSISADSLDRLEREFGVQAPDQGNGGQGDVAAAIDRQTAVMTALVDELRAAREDRDRIAGLERAVEQLLAAVGPIERAGAALRAPLAPRTGAESGR